MMDWYSIRKSLLINGKLSKIRFLGFLLLFFLVLNISSQYSLFLSQNVFSEQKTKKKVNTIFENNEEGIQKKMNFLTNLNPTTEVIRTLAQHTQEIVSLAFSPDGKILASGSEDNTIILWNMTSGEPLFTLITENDFYVTNLQFSSDGKTLISGSRNFHFWNVTSGELINTFTLWADQRDWSPNQQFLAVSDSNQIQIWDILSQNLLFNLYDKNLNDLSCLDFSSDGQMLAVGSTIQDETGEKISISFWKIETKELINSWIIDVADYQLRLSKILFSPDSNFLAVRNYEGTIFLYRIADKKLIIAFESSEDNADFAFSPCSEKLILLDNDKIVNYKILKGIDHQSFDFSFRDDVLAISPNGESIALATDNNQIKIVRTLKEKPKNVYIGHTDQIRDLVVGESGKYLASCSLDGYIHIWNISNGAVIQSLGGIEGSDPQPEYFFNRIFSIALGNDDQTLVSGSQEGMIHIWNLNTGSLVKSFIDGSRDSIMPIAVGTEHDILVTGTHSEIKIRNLTNFNLQHSIAVTDNPFDLELSPDGSFLAAALEDGTVQIIDTSSGGVVNTLTGHTSEVLSVTYSPDGQFILSSSADGTIRLWTASDGNLVRLMTGHASSVNSVAFSSDGLKFASCSSDNSIKLWNTNDGNEILTIEETIHTIEGFRDIVFSPDDKHIFCSSGDHKISMWDTTTGEQVRLFSGHKADIKNLILDPSEKFLYSCSEDETIRIWNLEDRTALVLDHNESVNDVKISLDGEKVYSCSSNKIYEWNASSGDYLRTINNTGQTKTALAISPNGEIIVSGEYNNIRVLNLLNRSKSITIADTQTQIYGIAFHPTENVFATCHDNTSIFLWNSTDGKLLRSLNGHTGSVRDVIFNLDGTILISSSEDATIRLWNVTTGSVIRIHTGHTGSVLCVALNSDGTFLASGSSDGTIRIWNIENNILIKTIKAHFDDVNGIFFRRNGTSLFSCSKDQSIKEWEIIDLDSDSINDSWENNYGLNFQDFWDRYGDYDKDNLMNILEYQFGTNPNQGDSDNDSIDDLYEFLNNMDGMNDDTSEDIDNDSIPNLYEYRQGLLAGVYDSNVDRDLDGILNGYEYQHGLLAGVDDASEDNDYDGMSNLYEFQNDLLANVNDANEDKDGDGLTNLEEFKIGTAANNQDSDNDGFNDKFEHDLWLDPRNSFINPISVIIISGLVVIATSITLSLGFKRRKRRKEFVKKYNAPNYYTAKLVRDSKFPDYETYHKAQLLGAISVGDLKLIQKTKAPDIDKAQKVVAGKFPDYKTYQRAKEMNITNFAELQLIDKYQAPDYDTAVKMQLSAFSDKIMEIIRLEKKFIYSSFISKPEFAILSKDVLKSFFEEKGGFGIQSSDCEVFLTNEYIKQNLQEAAKVYADLDFDTVARYLDIPSQYVAEILIGAVSAGIVIGMVDRTNKQFFIREIPISLLEQLVSGKLSSVEEVTKAYKSTLDDSLKTLQSQLPSNQYIIVRENDIIRIDQIKSNCQICGTANIADKVIKCEQCARDLCWDHYEELSDVGRAVCPFCDGSLVFLPKFCESCHIDYLKISKTKTNCDVCGYTLMVKGHLHDFHYKFILTQRGSPTVEKSSDPYSSESKKKLQ